MKLFQFFLISFLVFHL